MNPLAEVLLTVRSVAEAVKSVCELLMTPEGKAFMQQVAADHAAWDKFWSNAGQNLKVMLTWKPPL